MFKFVFTLSDLCWLIGIIILIFVFICLAIKEFIIDSFKFRRKKKRENKTMEFRRAYELMKNKGRKIKLPEWEGYWTWENDTIMIYCKDNKVLDIRETDDVAYTFSFICRNDWEVI